MKLFIHIVKKNSSAVISCQSVVKLYLQKLLNLTQLGSSTLNKTLFNILLKFKLGKHFNLGPLTNYLEFDLIFCMLKLGTNFNFEPLRKIYIVENQLMLTWLNSILAISSIWSPCQLLKSWILIFFNSWNVA